MQFVDTHCHLDAAEYAVDRDAVVLAAREAGVAQIVVPAVGRENFAIVAELDSRYSGCRHALGIHPMYVDRAFESDIAELDALLARGQAIAVGEIGLDFFVDGFDAQRQGWFFAEQLKLAQKYALPVLLHIRRAQDAVLKQLRRIAVPGGIAHAFNGSRQQADAFIRLGFKLGFGGALTYPRALRIRDHAASLPLDAIVLETDGPDIPPSFAPRGRNDPVNLPRIAAELARLRGLPLEALAQATTANAAAVLPQLAAGLEAA
ncbi:MAG: TatD family hydrolase [Sterolibacteriaceae bacterium]|nr:TatD family hydrolase [Candidatus Methylophosphatis haderslevensis]